MYAIYTTVTIMAWKENETNECKRRTGMYRCRMDAEKPLHCGAGVQDSRTGQGRVCVSVVIIVSWKCVATNDSSSQKCCTISTTVQYSGLTSFDNDLGAVGLGV